MSLKSSAVEQFWRYTVLPSLSEYKPGAGVCVYVCMSVCLSVGMWVCVCVSVGVCVRGFVSVFAGYLLYCVCA